MTRAQKLTQASAVLDGLIGVQTRVGAEMNQQVTSTADTSIKLLLGMIAAALLAGAGIAYFLSGGISRGVSEAGRAARGLAEGDLEQTMDIRSKDELGAMAASFREMIVYQQEMAGLAGAIARGDLTQSIEPKSERDQLGTAFHEMIRSLRDLVGQVQTSAISLAETSAQLGSAAAQTGSAVQQVTMAVQNVASGAQETSRSAQETTGAVSQLSQVIDGIARGATDQARQVQTTSATATQMAAGIEQVAANATQVATRQPAGEDRGRARRPGGARDHRGDGRDPGWSSARRPARSASWARSARRSARWSRPSTTSPSRPTCWR